jgi:hypothetical protein
MFGMRAPVPSVAVIVLFPIRGLSRGTGRGRISGIPLVLKKFNEGRAFSFILWLLSILGLAMTAAMIPGKASALPILNPANGHYYEAIVFSDESDFLTWDEARIATESGMFMGLPGYLATITSQEENDFLNVTFAPVRSPRGELWVGGSDDPVDGEWCWAVGPEAGTPFWAGGPAGTEILFADWATGEPNNALGPASESRLGWTELGWNDLPASGFGSVKPGYIVEFSSIPEPPTFSLLGLGLVVLGLIRQKRHLLLRPPWQFTR